METVFDTWLAHTLGCSAFKLVVPADTTNEQIVRGLQAPEPGFYYAKVPTHAVRQLYALAKCGFNVVDVSVNFARRPDARQGDPAGCTIVDYDVARHRDVARIGAECFVYSRFHLDPEFSNDIANRIKRAWVENCVAGKRGDRLLVAEADGRAVGFLAELHTSEDGRRATLIDLVGVDRSHQGRGIGRALVQHVVRRSTNFADSIRVGTQAANVPSLRLYESSGFRITDTQYVLHAHIEVTQR